MPDARPENKYVEGARRAVPTLIANAARTERDRRPTADSLAAVRQAGLFALTVPRSAGGPGVDRRTQVRVLAELGQGCASTAWVTALSISAKQSFGPLFPADAQSELYADPDAGICVSGVPAGAGTESEAGLRITGRWGMASGCEDATWAILLVPLRLGGQPAGFGLVLVPTADLSVDRTWAAAGMAGTGSHTLVADDLLVPIRRRAAATIQADGTAGIEESPTALLGEALLTVAPLLGAAQGALAVVTTLLATDKGPRSTTHARIADSPLARYWFSAATRLIDTARGRVLAVADALDRLIEGQQPALGERSRLRMELVTAAEECRQAVERLLDLHGASGFASSNPLQRFWRDLAVGSRHYQLSSYITAEDDGRVLLDVEAPVSLVL